MRRKLALITGASSGIGKAFAKYLAKEGYDLILIARRKSKMEALASLLANSYSTSTKIITADLSKLEEINTVVNDIRSLEEIDILINNAGFGLSDKFVEGNFERQIDMVKVHILASFSLCRAVLPIMLKKNEGLIINVSSMSGLMVEYGDVTYTATKSFLIVLSKALQEEIRKTNVKIQALCPGMTYSEFHDTEELKEFDRSTVPKLMWMTSDEVVKKSLNAAKKRKVVYVPGFLNRISLFFSKFILFRRISQYVILKNEKKQQQNRKM